MAGSTNSTDGDIASPPKGQSDMWIVKLDMSRNLAWQKTPGGTGIGRTAFFVLRLEFRIFRYTSCRQ